MAGGFDWLFIAVAGCACDVIVYVITFRLSSRARHSRALLAGACGGLAVLSAAAMAIGIALQNFAVAILVYFCFAYTIFHVAQMGQTARRVRLAIELAAAPAGLTRSQLIGRYNAREMVDRRLARLIHGGQIRLVGSRYYLFNSAARLMAAIIRTLKIILKSQTSLPELATDRHSPQQRKLS